MADVGMADGAVVTAVGMAPVADRLQPDSATSRSPHAMVRRIRIIPPPL
jgi:hypothetical protein